MLNHFETPAAIDAPPAEVFSFLDDPPNAKTWKTVGSPRPLVIGAYNMGFLLTPRQGGSLPRVFIDYSPPSEGALRLMGRLFGKSNARWCTNRIARDVTMHFNTRRGHS